MKTITWEWRKKIITDYFIFPWLQISRHFEGTKNWSYAFHWKNGHVWYHNFRRHVADDRHMFLNTRLTLRFGKRIICFGNVDMNRYYRDVKVLVVKNAGKIIYKCLEGEGKYNTTKEDIAKAVNDANKSFWHLNKAYPNNTWMN